MKTTFIIEIVIHVMHISQKIANIKVCEMQTVSRLERCGCGTFCTGDKKQYNLDY